MHPKMECESPFIALPPPFAREFQMVPREFRTKLFVLSDFVRSALLNSMAFLVCVTF